MKYDALLELMSPILAHPTTITALHDEARRCLKMGDIKKSKRLEHLIRIFHNSYVPATVEIGIGTTFAYGGIGTILHAQTKVGKNCSIGSNVTIGGGQGAHPMTKSSVPHIEDNVYIATGAKIFGPVLIGKFSIIGANSVVTKDVPSFTIIAGNPAKEVKRITSENYLKYKSFIGRNIEFGENIFN